MCLFQCGPDRISYNWTQYMNTLTPEHWQGGGGWSQIRFSLGSLYEQHDYLNNIWTSSNIGLPLVRYKGCLFKFYRTYDVDYIVHYTTCQPMLDTVYQHSNAQPQNMLMYKKKILVKCLKRRPNGKLYVKKWIKPPEQFQNTWYFQKDLCNEGLVMLTTTAIDFDRYYLNPQSDSNSITFICLNPKVFQNHNFKNSNLGTTEWRPNNNWYLYGGDGREQKVGDLVFLGQTISKEPGKPIDFITKWDGTAAEQGSWENFRKDKLLNFGNPFFDKYLHGEYNVYTTNKTIKEMWQQKTTALSSPTVGVTRLIEPLTYRVRYCPNKDNGHGNIIYLLSNSDHTGGWDPPDDIDLQYDGFPLWTLWWGWTDWQVKLKKAKRIPTDYLCCFRSAWCDPPLTSYCPIDQTYFDGNSPYQKDHFNVDDWDKWYICQRYQMTSIDNICKSGPGTIKTSNRSIEAHCFYQFYFKWGGCPNNLEHIADPCEQKQYPIPHQELQGPAPQNPETSPTKETYEFDFRRDIITPKAAKRLKTDSKTTISLQTDSTKLNSAPTTEIRQTFQKEDETSTEEEEETSLEQQLQQLRHHRKRLRSRINRLIQHIPNLKY